MRAPVRHGVLHVRVLPQLRDRLSHRVAVLDLELLGAAGKLRDRLGARLGRDVRGDAPACARLVAHEHLVGHVVGRARARGQEQQRPKGGYQEDEAYRHWATVGFGVYERTNNPCVAKL
jgi:hypothetical protein